jgi:O-antigen/teichoic acid export membrane protein
MKESEKPAAAAPAKQESLLWNLALNIVIPVIVLRQGDKFIASSAAVLVLALAFPVAYFLYDLKTRGKKNFISILGFVSILLTGGIGLLELPRNWVIVKEAAIPALIGLAVLISLYTPYPLVKTLLYSPQIFDVERIQNALRERATEKRFQGMLTHATVLLAISFFFSAVLNYFVAAYFIQTEPSVDRAQFNREIGQMTAWSWLIIAVPSLLITIGALFYLVRGIRLCTGLKLEEAIAESHREAEK